CPGKLYRVLGEFSFHFGNDAAFKLIVLKHAVFPGGRFQLMDAAVLQTYFYKIICNKIYLSNGSVNPPAAGIVFNEDNLCIFLKFQYPVGWIFVLLKFVFYYGLKLERGVGQLVKATRVFV